MTIFGRWTEFAQRRRLVAAAGLLSSLTIVSRAVSAGRDVLIAAWFGRSSETDSYFLSLVVVAWAAGLVGSVVQLAVVPRFAEHTVSEPTKLADATGRTIASSMRWALLLLAGTLVLAPAAFRLFELSPASASLASKLLLLMSPAVLLSVCTSVVSAALSVTNNYGYLGTAAVSSSATALVVLALLGSDASPVSLATSFLAGAAAEMLLVLISFRWLHGCWPQLRGVSGGSAIATAHVGLAMVATMIGSLSPIVDHLLAGELGSSELSTLGYAYRLNSVGLGLVAGVLGSLALPTLAALAASGDWRGLQASYRRQQRVVLSICGAATAVMVLVAPFLVRGLFERGAFTGSDSTAIGRTLQVMSLQVPLAASATLALRGLVVLGKYGSYLLASLLGVLANAASDVVLRHWFGVNGIAAASTVTALTVLVCADGRFKAALHRKLVAPSHLSEVASDA